MNSLEALDELSLMINREKHINSEWNKKINDLKQTIKQDLELKEQLEKRNKELVNIIDELREENFKIKQIQTCIWGEQDTVRQTQLIDLLKENQELLVNKNFAQGVALKYKKVIEILKDKRVDLDIFMNCKTLEEYNNAIEYTYKSISENYKLTPQEYDLLKEVLKDE